MGRPIVMHLVDDGTAGGVMRVLDHLTSSPELARFARHRLLFIERGALLQRPIVADVIVSHMAVSWRTLPLMIALKLRNPDTALVHVEHSYTEGFTLHNVTHKLRFAMLLRITYGLFDRIIAVSGPQAAWLVRSGAVKAAQLTVIRSCVNLSGFRALPRPCGQVRIIGAIGRLDQQKGFEVLIKAFRLTSNRDVALHVYGTGAQEEELHALAGADSRIRFFGHTDPLKAMAAVDIVAMPSLWEAYGLVAIEALTAGRKLLVNAVDGLQDHIPNGAIAVSGGRLKDWKLAIEACSQNEPAICGTALPEFETAFVEAWHQLMVGLCPSNRHSVLDIKDRSCRTTRVATDGT